MEGYPYYPYLPLPNQQVGAASTNYAWQATKFPTSQNTWIWSANAEEAIKNQNVNPGSMVAVFDTETEWAFFKFIDTSTGKPVINKARLIFENNNKTNTGFATKEDFDILSKNIADLREEFDSLTIKRGKKKEDE